MADAYLLVPGTGGITLMDSAGNDLGYPAKMELGVQTGGLLFMSASSLVDLLSMEHLPGQAAPLKTSLRPGVSIRPGHALRVAYELVPPSFNTFLYDWRADLLYSAGLLRDFLEQRKPPGGRWRVVGHSQGALLIVLASKLFGASTDFARCVASVALVAGPLAGTVNAARALVTGDLMGPAGQQAFQVIVRTWPAIYQMMPSWDGFVPSAGGTGQAMTDPGAWQTLPGVSADFLARTRDVQQRLREPLSFMDGDVSVAIVLMKNRPTGVNLELDGAGPTGTSRDFKLGDTLVPYDETLAWLGPTTRPFLKTITGPVREHAFVFDDPTVMNTVLQALG
jgi:pimeloyl-ACP methyl ester carboxylesterase